MPRWSQQDKFRIAERRKTVASLYLRGKFQGEIAQEVSVDRGTVSRDLKAIEREWLKSGVMDLNAAKARELAKIDEVERQAWVAWEQSRKDAETMEVIGTAQGGKGKPDKVKKITKGQAGDSRFLAIIVDCTKRRCELLGLDAPRRNEISGRDAKPIEMTSENALKVDYDPKRMAEVLRILHEAGALTPEALWGEDYCQEVETNQANDTADMTGVPPA